MRSPNETPGAPPFETIWFVTRGNSPAKITCRLDLLAAVLDGTIEASSQVHADGSDSQIPAAAHPLLARFLSARARLAGNRWLFTILSLLAGAGLIIPIMVPGYQGWKTLFGLVFVVLMLRETYKAVIGAVELTRGRQILLFAASIILFVIGFVAADAVTELGRLLFFPDVSDTSDWLAIPFFVLCVLVLTGMSILWERFEPDQEPSLRHLPPGPEKSALVAQRAAKKRRIKGIIGIEGCRAWAWPEGRRYEGAVHNGKQHGLGVFTWADGTRHEGEWQNGKRHGYGVVVAPDGTQTPGKWQDDRMLNSSIR